MKRDLSAFRMSDYNWVEQYIQKMSKETFWNLLNKRYGWLMGKPKGWKYNLLQSKALTNDEDRDLFVKTCCLFISEGNSSYQFNSDYTLIYRI